MVPARPRERRAVRAEPGEGVEVAPGREQARLASAVGGQRDKLVRRLVPAVGLAHAHDQPPVRAHAAVGVAHRARLGRLGRDRPRRLARVEAVEPLIGEVREEGAAAVEEPGAAAVLVDAGSHVHLRRGHVLPIVDERRAPFVLGPSLEPPGRAVLAEPRLREPHPRLRRHGRGQGRTPRAIGDGRHGRRMICRLSGDDRRGLSNRAIAARLFVTPAPSRLTPSRSSPSRTSTRGRIHTAECWRCWRRCAPRSLQRALQRSGGGTAPPCGLRSIRLRSTEPKVTGSNSVGRAP